MRIGSLTSMALLSFNLTGCQDPTSGKDGLPALWGAGVTTPGQEWVNGRPAVDAGRVYIQEANTLAAIDAANGRRLWTRSIRVAAAPSPTALLAADGVVYVSETDSVMAVDGATGQTIWSVHPDSQAVVVPALDAAALYTGQRGLAFVYAVDRTTGGVRWKVNPLAGSGFPTFVHGLAVSGDTLYATLERDLDQNGVRATGVLVALDARSGAELWRYETATTHSFFYGAPVVLAGEVVANDFYGGAVVAIDRTTHRERWRADVAGAAGLGFADGLILTAAADTKVRALDAGTGTVRWTASSGSSAFGVGVCGQSFFVSAFHLLRFDVATGTLTGEAQRDQFLGFFSDIASDGTHAFAVAGRGTFAFGC